MKSRPPIASFVFMPRCPTVSFPWPSTQSPSVRSQRDLADESRRDPLAEQWSRALTRLMKANEMVLQILSFPTTIQRDPLAQLDSLADLSLSEIVSLLHAVDENQRDASLSESFKYTQRDFLAQHCFVRNTNGSFCPARLSRSQHPARSPRSLIFSEIISLNEIASLIRTRMLIHASCQRDSLARSFAQR